MAETQTQAPAQTGQAAKAPAKAEAPKAPEKPEEPKAPEKTEELKAAAGPKGKRPPLGERVEACEAALRKLRTFLATQARVRATDEAQAARAAVAAIDALYEEPESESEDGDDQ